jgi:integrase
MAIFLRYRYVHEDVSRHGTVRLYFRRRRGGPKIRIHETPGTEAFSRRYHELLAEAGQPAAQPARGAPATGTLGWLVSAYLVSAAIRSLDPATQRQRQLLLEACMREPLQPGGPRLFSALPLGQITRAHLEVLRDRKRTLPGAAANRVKALRGLLAWAGEEGHVSPATADLRHRLKKPSHRSTGHHTWTPAEIAQFEAAHPLGTRARLAFAVLLWTGVRRSDAVRLGRQHVRDGWIVMRQHKGRNRHPTTIELPVLPELARALEAGPTGELTWIVNERGRPWVVESFGNWFRDQCTAAGLPHCSAHGLRKAGATLAAERGATAHELMALFGWRGLADAEGYTRRADRRRLAERAAHLLAGSRESLAGPDRAVRQSATSKRRRGS